MKIENNVDLYMFSTMRTRSVGSRMYTPCCVEELKEIIRTTNGDCYFLGGGSNIVFASYVSKPIVNLMEVNGSLALNDDGTITAGCSVRIQKLINFGKDLGLGGFEYLFSLPASVGGIVYMNAGRGKVHKQQVSDWLEYVEYLDLTDMLVKKMVVDKSEWTYRHSPFQEMKAVILSVTFKMKKSTIEKVEACIKERKDFVHKTQEGNLPSCGSVFNNNNKYIMRLFRGKRIGGAHFSKKTNNWISNDRNGSADDVIALIKRAEKWHRLLNLKCKLEVRIFE